MWGVLSGPRVRRFGVVAAVLAVLAVAGCGDTTRFATPGGDPGQSAPLPPLDISVSGPADKATGVLTSTEFGVQTNGKVKKVTLTGPDGKAVDGGFPRGDGTWVPGSQLAYGTTYRLDVTAAQGRREKTVTSTFTTMARPAGIVGADVYISDGDTVGVGMPIVVEFTATVPEAKRAEVEKRLFVTPDKSTVGSWHWFSGDEVHWRPKEYWKQGTTVDVRIGIGGMDFGNATYGKRDRVFSFTVGSKIIAEVDNASHTMKVYKDGELVKEMPVSLGKPASPTSAGTHVLMEKKAETMFDSSTYGTPVDSADGYRTKVYWAVRFTWGGEFTHAAPWSVADQGHRNVSHGCVNLSTENAKWYFDFVKKGDILKINGTEAQVKPGDGWTDWNMSWEQYKAGSALN